MRIALSLALASGVLLVLVAVFRRSLSAPASSTFSSIFLLPFLAGARFAAQASIQSAPLLATGVLVLGAGAHFLARAWNRRGLDAVLCAILTFELFWLARHANSFLPPAGPLAWSTLALAQRANLALGVLLILFLLAAWACGPARRSRYEGSAPSRITRFLKKRRMRTKSAGAVLMALAMIAIFVAARGAWMVENSWLAPVWAFAIFIVADAVYVGGRKLWTRLG